MFHQLRYKLINTVRLFMGQKADFSAIFFFFLPAS